MTLLAQKYRPKRLEDIAGQDITVEVLTQAIKNNKDWPVILLCGMHGVGKTTTARILAKIWVCSGASRPCDICNNCILTSKDTHPDIREIDAASHTGIDDIRDIIDISQYNSTVASCRVLIMDEVHMLSKNAFSALLKLIEEPPANMRMIFATTEIQKIPDPVLSRCIRFDLNCLDQKDLSSYLKKICDKEDIQYEESALELIADVALGSVRDSLFILEKAIIYSFSVSPKHISLSVVEHSLGVRNKTKIIELTKSLLIGDSSQALLYAQELFSEGENSAYLINQISRVIHALSVLKIKHEPGLNKFLQSEAIEELSKKTDLARLMHVWQMLIKGQEELNLDMSYRTVEMLFIRIAHTKHMIAPEKIIDSSTVRDINSSAELMRALEYFGEEEVIKELKRSRHLSVQEKIVIFNKNIGEVVINKTGQTLKKITGFSWVIKKEKDLLDQTLELFPGSIVKDKTE